MKTRRLIFFYLIALSFFVACTKTNSINVVVDNVNGLNEGDKVICKGKEVGKVSDISFVGRDLNIELQLQKEFFIPKGSKIYLVSTDILGSRAISITLSGRKEYYTKNDTLKCYNKSETKLDTTLMIINSAIKEIKDSIPKLTKK
ncbi:MlaD family protein [Seonamhaeicola sp.]|uniref:MlaD family protein n=1 Tax=Seonamhaeicola sp. TaxID=1912245 RepID=UPI002610541D|nr:MlaD family protein [Seonamhaeicola sp.]